MGMVAPVYYTADMVRALPDDGNRYEVIDGELFVTPAPSARHQRAVTGISARLWNYLRGTAWGEVMSSPADISFSEDRLVQPDVFVAPLGPGGRKPRQWSEIRGLLLAVEVLSAALESRAAVRHASELRERLRRPSHARGAADHRPDALHVHLRRRALGEVLPKGIVEPVEGGVRGSSCVGSGVGVFSFDHLPSCGDHVVRAARVRRGKVLA